MNKLTKDEEIKTEQLQGFNEEEKAVLSAAPQKITEAVNTLIDHLDDKNNPHVVTTAQVGLENVENLAVNDLTPTYTDAVNLSTLASGEKLSLSFGKISKAVSTLIDHIPKSGTTSEPGHVQLTDSISSVSTTTAATPSSVKMAYDLAENAIPKANISSNQSLTETGTYVLDAVEKNADIPGTLANEIGLLNTEIQDTFKFEVVKSNTFSTSTTTVQQVAYSGGYAGYTLVSANVIGTISGVIPTITAIDPANNIIYVNVTSTGNNSYFFTCYLLYKKNI